MPLLTNLRLDPFERTGWPDSGTKFGAQQYFDWFKYEFWRFVFVQQQVEKLAMTAIEFPPMQKGASFNLDAVKAKNSGSPGGSVRQLGNPAASEDCRDITRSGTGPGGLSIASHRPTEAAS